MSFLGKSYIAWNISGKKNLTKPKCLAVCLLPVDECRTLVYPSPQRDWFPNSLEHTATYNVRSWPFRLGFQLLFDMQYCFLSPYIDGLLSLTMLKTRCYVLMREIEGVHISHVSGVNF